MTKPTEATDSRIGQWQLDAAAVEAYERCLVPAIFQPWAVELVDRAALRAGERILDLACGTGAVAVRAVACHKAETYAVDLNPHMLHMARAAAARAGLNVRCRIGNAGQLPLPDASVNVVLCQQGFQFFNDKDCAAGEIARVLCQDGRVLASVWSEPSRNPWAEALLQAFKARDEVDHADVLTRPFRLPAADAAVALKNAGFSKVTTSTISLDLFLPPDFFSGMLASLPSMAASPLTPSAQSAIVSAAAMNLAPFRFAGGFRVPSEAAFITGSGAS
jgi:ubiquinone/menaquinone biosynthesis C-methylase UbiE